MPFRYTLEPVLKLRASFERLERNRLLLISAAIARVRDALELLGKDMTRAHDALLAKLASGVPVAELELDRLLQASMRDRHRALKRREEELQSKRQIQQLAYLAAKDRREILDRLRERRYAQYSAEQLRREQRRLDELFLLRRAALQQNDSE